jgi:integrase/recombinase XerD
MFHSCVILKNMKVSEASGPFFTWAEIERQHAPQTIAKLRDCFASWILPRLGPLEVEQIRREHILEIRQAMVNRKLSVARQYSVISAIKHFLRFCQTVLRISTLDLADVVLPRRPKPNPDALTNEELERIRQAININMRTGLRLRALIELLAETGMRIGEALALNRTPFEQGDAEIEILGKGNKLRTIFIHQRAGFWVRQYLARRVDHEPALFVTTGDPPQRWARVDVSPFFVRLRKAAKINKKLTPHLLRHTFCTNLRDNGADISLIKDLAGHADIQTTARYYLKTDKSALRNAVKKYLNYDVKSFPR